MLRRGGAIGIQQVLAKFFATTSEPEMFFTSEGDKASKWRFLHVAAAPASSSLGTPTSTAFSADDDQCLPEEGLHAAADLLTSAAADASPLPLPSLQPHVLEHGQPFFAFT